MSEQTGKVDDSQSPPQIKKKFRKGDLVKVDREKYSQSLESKASDANLPEYVIIVKLGGEGQYLMFG